MSLNSDFESYKVDYDSEIDRIIDFDNSTDNKCDGGIDAQVQALSSKITVYCKILN